MMATARAPRPMAWVLLLASAAAVLLTGLAATALILSHLAPARTAVHPRYWLWLLAGGMLTTASLGGRALRWIFLLRRSEVRIPIRDAYIGYLAGFSLLFAPLLLGEIAVRVHVHRQRGPVSAATIALVNIWERVLDLAALATIAGVLLAWRGQGSWFAACLLGGAAATMVGAVRRLLLGAVVRAVSLAARDVPDVRRLAGSRTWWPAFATSLLAWTLPGVALWGLAGAWGTFSLAQAQAAYAASSLTGGLVLAPGGILVIGGHLLRALAEAGLSDTAAVLTVVGIRLATVGVSTVLGGTFLLIHLRTRVPDRSSHFDTIADAYDVQIPESRRRALLTRKTELMCEAITVNGVGRRGLDVGCGQGWYVARMRNLGYDVVGIDASEGQVQLAVAHVGDRSLVTSGSALQIPAPAGCYDFVYTINVLHHLASIDEQKAAFVELLRVLKPGGLLFVHEINTRNLLFRFYMGYIFPSLNCIDEGVERWLLPPRLASYTDARVLDVKYFTFLPDFIPESLATRLSPIERRLEASPLGVYSAHYMAVIRKPV